MTAIDNLDDLISYLTKQIIRAQKSERWAMYRLIAPVVDFANRKNNLMDYFEYNQTSVHGAPQSIDIALLKNDLPLVAVEAKRVDRTLSSGQITKYLEDGVRGAVTNGIDWILCWNGKYKAVPLLDTATKKVIEKNILEVISFISLDACDTSDWSTTQQEVAPWIRPYTIEKKRLALHKENDKEIIAATGLLKARFAENPAISDLERVFLDSMCEEFERQGGKRASLRVEFRSSRLSFFDESSASNHKRVFRIEFGKKHPDILILAEIVNHNPELSETAVPFEHDKGSHMSRFRLSEVTQAKIFGAQVVRAVNI